MGRQRRAEERLYDPGLLAQVLDQRRYVVGGAALEGEAVEPETEIDARLMRRDARARSASAQRERTSARTAAISTAAAAPFPETSARTRRSPSSPSAQS